MPSKNAVNIVNKSCSQCDVIRMFPISFRISLRLYGTYHRITPWLIGFIVGYFLHKYQHLATFQKLEELRNRRVTWRKVRAICTPLTNCQCHRAACLASQHKKKMRFFVVFFSPSMWFPLFYLKFNHHHFSAHVYQFAAQTL